MPPPDPLADWGASLSGVSGCGCIAAAPRIRPVQGFPTLNWPTLGSWSPVPSPLWAGDPRPLRADPAGV